MKYLAVLPATVLVTIRMPKAVTITTAVRMGEVISIITNTVTRVATEEIHWGMDWEIICRRVSISPV